MPSLTFAWKREGNRTNVAIGDTHLLDEFEITITAEEPPSGGGNVTARYAKGTRIGVFSLSSVAAAVASLNGAMLKAQLALQPGLSLVRSLPVAGSELLPLTGALRVLVMASAPDDLLPRLDVEREWSHLQSAVAGAAIELVRVDPTYEALLGALRQHTPSSVTAISCHTGAVGLSPLARMENR